MDYTDYFKVILKSSLRVARYGLRGRDFGVIFKAIFLEIFKSLSMYR